MTPSVDKEELAEAVMNEVIDEVIKSENSTPSIPAVVLDTFDEVIKNEPSAPTTPAAAPNEKEEQETSLIIEDDDDSGDHQKPDKKTEPAKTVEPSNKPSSTAPATAKTAGEANGHVQGDMLESTEVLNRVVPPPSKFEKKRGSTSQKKIDNSVEMRNKDISIDPSPKAVSLQTSRILCIMYC